MGLLLGYLAEQQKIALGKAVIASILGGARVEVVDRNCGNLSRRDPIWSGPRHGGVSGDPQLSRLSRRGAIH
jgi:hypothetical protein